MEPPPGCLEGCRLTPHALHAPERPELARLARLDLRRALFALAAQHVRNIELGASPWRGRALAVEEVRPGDCAAPPFAPNLADRLFKGAHEGEELLHCEEWRVRAGGAERRYRLKYLQSANDAFRAEAYPPTLGGYCRDFFFNRQFRRA